LQALLAGFCVISTGSACEEAKSTLFVVSTVNHCFAVVTVTEYVFPDPYAGHAAPAAHDAPPVSGVGPEELALGVGEAAAALTEGVGDGVAAGALAEGVGVLVGFGFVEVLFTGTFV
jgi:hypothetical protein